MRGMTLPQTYARKSEWGVETGFSPQYGHI